MAAGRQVKSFLLFAAAFLVLLAAINFSSGRAAASVFALSSFLLFLAIALSSWGFGVRKAFLYCRILPLPRGWTGWAATLKWSAGAFLLSWLATIMVSSALYFLGLLDSALVEEKLLALPPAALVLAFTLSPVAEEALFRGYFFRKIAEGPGKRPSSRSLFTAAILSSLLFALLHFPYGSVAEIAVAFAVGAVLCFITQKSGSLLPAMLAHASFNLLSIATAVL